MMKSKRTLGELRTLPDNVDETRTVEFVISSGRKDRHGTILDIDGWVLDSYNGTVGYQHDVYGDNILQSPDPDSVIGKARVFRDGEQLIGEVTFEPADINPKAEKVFKKLKFGTLRSASVGFLPIEKGKWGSGDQARGERNETYYYGKRELLEFSIVNIPSNPDAVMRKFEDEGLREVMEDEQKEIEDTQKTDSVPEHEQIGLLIELSKIV